MRQGLILLLLGLVFTATMHAQEIVAADKMWSTMQEHCQPWGNTYSTDHYKFAEDTLINDTLYKRVYTANDEFYEEWFFYGAFIREENKKVYLREMFGKEGLIYDFNLQIGDSCMVNNPRSFSEIKLTLNAIDSIETSDGYRLRYRLDNEFYPDPEYWYEGIGSEAGVLNSGTAVFGGLCGSYTMLCEKENEVVIYQNPIYQTCYYLITGETLPLEEFEDKGFKLTYNQDLSTVYVIFPDQAKRQIYLSNMSGKQLFLKTVDQSIIAIPLQEAIRGLYILTVVDEGKTSTKKFMVF